MGERKGGRFSFTQSPLGHSAEVEDCNISNRNGALGRSYPNTPPDVAILRAESLDFPQRFEDTFG